MKLFESFLDAIGQSLIGEGPKYTTILKHQKYELRRYGSCIVAETMIESTHEKAGNEGFFILFDYIRGKNDGNIKIDMMGPVAQVQVAPGKYAIQFFMPAKWALQTLPQPLDHRVTLKKRSKKTFFVIRYLGGWSEQLYQKAQKNLIQEVEKQGIKLKRGCQPIWARYNSPFAIPLVRTNEIMYEIQP